MAGVVIRDFNPRDLAAVLEIQQSAPEMAQWRAEDYERLVETPDGLILMAEWPGDGTIAGFVAARAIAEEAELQNLAVRHEYRRRGVARQLVEALQTRLMEAGVKRIFLEARASNLPALNLYRSFGYAECGLRRNYYASDGEDALVFERRLAA